MVAVVPLLNNRLKDAVPMQAVVDQVLVVAVLIVMTVLMTLRGGSEELEEFSEEEEEQANIALVALEETLEEQALMATTAGLDTTKLRIATTIGGDLSEVAMVSSLFNTKSLKEV